MSQAKKPNLKIARRGFTSVLAMMSFAILAVTGVVLFFVPPGRIANWYGWTFMGLTKAQWGALHIHFSVLFLIMAAIHLTLNWRPMLNYFRSRAPRKFTFRWQWALPLAVVILFATGSLRGWPGFESLIDYGEGFKKGYDEKYAQKEKQAAPPHAELLTLAELAEETDLDLEQAETRLRDRGLEIESTSVAVGDLAEQANLTPAEIFDIAAGIEGRRGGQGRRGGREESVEREDHAEGRGGAGAGRGFGRMTLAEYSERQGFGVDRALARLSEAGIEAKETDTLRDLHEVADIDPFELRELIDGE